MKQLKIIIVLLLLACSTTQGQIIGMREAQLQRDANSEVRTRNSITLDTTYFRADTTVYEFHATRISTLFSEVKKHKRVLYFVNGVCVKGVAELSRADMRRTKRDFRKRWIEKQDYYILGNTKAVIQEQSVTVKQKQCKQQTSK